APADQAVARRRQRLTRPRPQGGWERLVGALHSRPAHATHRQRRRTRMRTALRMSALALSVTLAGATLLAAGAATPAAAQTPRSTMTTASGLKIEDTKVGTGASPKTGQTCVMHYTGWLYQDGQKGQKFDSSVDRGQPFEFQIGRGMVIKGWDEGV